MATSTIPRSNNGRAGSPSSVTPRGVTPRTRYGIVSKPVQKLVGRLTLFQGSHECSVTAKQHDNKRLALLDGIERAVQSVNLQLGSLRRSPWGTLGTARAQYSLRHVCVFLLGRVTSGNPSCRRQEDALGARIQHRPTTSGRESLRPKAAHVLWRRGRVRLILLRAFVRVVVPTPLGSSRHKVL